MLRGELSATLSLIYYCTEVAKTGEFILNFGDDVPLIPLEEIEHVMAAHCINRIQQIHTYESSPSNPSTFDDQIKYLNAPPKQHLSHENQDVMKLTHCPIGIYYEAMLKLNYLTHVQQTAVQIALAQQRGEAFTGNLPLHYKTGKPVVWDKENKLLHTGLEAKEYQDHSTINIPSLGSNGES